MTTPSMPGFPELTYTKDAATVLENERDGNPVGRTTYSTYLQRYFLRLNYKQLCWLLRLSNEKVRDCRREANRLIKEGITSGTVDITKNQYDDDEEGKTQDPRLDEFGRYVLDAGVGETDDHITDMEAELEDLMFLLPAPNQIELGVFIQDGDDSVTYSRRRLFAKKKLRRRAEAPVCASLEAHKWQLPEAEKLYNEADVYLAIRSRCLENLRGKFQTHHMDLGAKMVLEALDELTQE